MDDVVFCDGGWMHWGIGGRSMAPQLETKVAPRENLYLQPSTVEQTGPEIMERRTYLGPDAKKWDPIILWGEDIFGRGAFDWHPHKGFETITYVVSGALEHRDSMGNRGLVSEGGVQWTTAGSGLLHDEQPAEGQVHGFQLWLNLPRALKDSPPRHQDLPSSICPVWRGDGVEATVFAGSFNGVTGPAELLHPAVMAAVDVSAGCKCLLDVDSRFSMAIAVVSGRVSVNGGLVDEQAALFMGPGGVVELRADVDAKFLVFGGLPIGEPVSIGFPFVMNTDEEIVTARVEAAAGKFGRPLSE